MKKEKKKAVCSTVLVYEQGRKLVSHAISRFLTINNCFRILDNIRGVGHDYD
jgi:hypothetical protein